MQEQEVLEQIWSARVEPRHRDRSSPLAQLLDTIFSVPTIGLVSTAGLSQPVAMMEGREMVMGATLGDILSEELDIDVPAGAIVLIEPAQLADADGYSAAELGQMLGQIMVNLVGEVFPHRAAQATRRPQDALPQATAYARAMRDQTDPLRRSGGDLRERVV